MDKIINAIILIVVALAIVYWLLPLLTGILHTIALVLVVVGAIVGLMKIAGMWF